MKSKILLLLVFLIGYNTIESQRVRSEIIQVKKRNSAFIPLPLEAKTFSSNNVYLQIHGLERVNSDADLRIVGKMFPAYRHSEWAIGSNVYLTRTRSEDILFSQPVELTITDRDGQILYYRVFNYFKFTRDSETSPNVYMESDMFAYNGISEHLSYMFSPLYEPEFRTRLHYIHRSDDHDDLNHAYNIAMEAVEKYNDGNTEPALKLFYEAIDIWQNALKEADLNNRRSRINRNIAEGVYRNLMQVLSITGRFEEAGQIIEESKEAMGVMFNLRIARHEYNKQRMELMAKGKDERFTNFFHFELDPDQKPLLSGGHQFLPSGIPAISNYIVGSWRYYAVTPDGLPHSAEDFDALNHTANLPDETVELLHLLPDGSKINQEGSWERSERYRLDDPMPFWRVFNGPDGHPYLIFAYEQEEFDDIAGNMRHLDLHRIFHVCDERLVLMSPNFNPNSDVSGNFIHLQRVGLVTDL
ncbi:hypothetical protein [Natronoflexus pectinivorans]|uniref:Uncharacterized protein n=1 Tax=Natronoflexus pectinivorans TaxID=682526 RepID=A0A4R2GHP9_9BACT|nr:hypothetical protein [Natronoflexus pectinivorans]TCO07906.1 hypothetical protein EV194_10647 [Natronoflexus pectinivorans]